MSQKTGMPNPKFRSGQFVNRVNGNSAGGKGIVRISGEPIWSEVNNQYWYGIGYQSPVREENKMGRSGGSSYSWPESDFEEIDNPVDLLIIAKFERSEELLKARSRISQLDFEIRNIEFSLNLVNPIVEEGDQE